MANKNSSAQKKLLENGGSEASSRVSVVVLGDVGHSPRMAYHCLSFAEEGFDVDFLGYLNSRPQAELCSHPKISIVPLRKVPSSFNSLPNLVRFGLRVLWQAFTLWFTLLFSKRPQYLLLQNPPCVPALPVCWFYCLLFRVHLVLDWHNYGYSILALALGPRHPLVHIYKTIEKVFGRMASSGLCVSRAMKDDLRRNWGVERITVHYDRPPTRFHPISIEAKHDLFLKLSVQLPCLGGSAPDKTVFTERFADGRVCYCEDRPALLVSSTSWTEDEDFSILLHALSAYEESALQEPTRYPRLIVIVTGKGPLKEYYIELAKQCAWQTVQLDTVWLEAADYPLLLASADMGLSLHTSSSGLDLPMKVVDMFGCGLPVIAQHYSTIEELVKPNVNGVTFKTEEQLADRLLSWFAGFPHSDSHKKRRATLIENIEHFRRLRWHECWQCNVLPIFSERCSLPPEREE